MEKRYYFRGLGLGIIVTAVIMGISLLGGGKKREMTDAEVIARAKELGMIEDSRLLEPAKDEGEDADGEGDKKAETPVKKDVAVAADKVQTKEKQESADQTQEKPVVATPESASEPKEEKQEKSGSAASGQEKSQTDTNEMTKQDEDVPIPEADKTVSVTISNGDGSYTVAKKLADAGAVSSAEAYDDFLCANGYDKKLRTGTFQIPANASGEQIARIVTGQQ